MKVDVLKTRIEAEKADQYLLTVGNPPFAMAVLGEMQKASPYLYSVFVAPNRRRRGVGLALVQEAISIARKAKKTSLNLWVNKKSPAAIALYKSAGFIVVQDEKKMMMNHGLDQECK